MSVSQVPIRPIARGSLTKLWLAVAALIAIAYGVAVMGAGQLRPEVSPSGLEFRTVKNGSGALIAQQDAVLVEYVGTLDDGSLFDSSQGRPVPLTPMGTVPGFAEALLKMQKGGHYKFRLPPDLAYGNNPPQGIPANAALNFDVKVIDVVPGAGPMVMMQAQQAQQGQ